MRTLKNLTRDECVNIATIANPEINWVFIECPTEYEWNGFDLVDKDSEHSRFREFIFQIDYSENIKQEFRFRLYKNLEEYRVTNLEEIVEYLKSIKILL
ncbi:MAG: hypothetical protein ACOCVF_03130 [bacterium]